MPTINLTSQIIEERLEAVPVIEETANTAKTNAATAQSRADSAYSRADAAYSRADEAFTSVSSGKKLVASAITDKGVTTAQDATFAVMAANIASIPTGSNKYTEYYTHSATSTATRTIDTNKNYVVMSMMFRSASYFAVGVWTLNKGVLTAVKTGTGSTSYLAYVTPTISGSTLTIPRAYNTSYPSYYLIAEVE